MDLKEAEALIREADRERSKTGLPSEVWVCGHRYAVRPRDNILSFGVHGACKFEEGVIEISVGQSRTQQQETLWHEMLHACDRTLNIGITDAVRRVKDDAGLRLNEPEVLALAHAQWATMTDLRNKSVMHWLLGEEPARPAER